jgi:hypothetical protein
MLPEGAVMVRTVWPRVFLVVVVLLLSFFALPASAALRTTRARAVQKQGIFASIWHAVITLLPPVEKIGPGMDPLGNQGTAPSTPPTSGSDLRVGMDPLG